MRKITLLLAFLAFTGLTFSQVESEYTQSGTLEKATQNVQAKAYGDIIWSEDFDGAKWKPTVVVDENGYLLDPDVTLPEGWTIIDNNELDYFWHWSDVGPRGVYTAGDDGDPFTPWTDEEVEESMPDGTSLDNGYFMLESDYFNSTEAGELSSNPIEMDAILQYGPIDFSNHGGAIFNLKTLYRHCCSASAMIGLEISSNYNPADESGDWTVVPLNVLTNGNEYTRTAERDNHINVSKYVGNKPAVYFRLRQTLSSAYMWIVDDLNFYEPPTNDIILKDGFADYIYDATSADEYVRSSSLSHNFWGGYTEIPKPIVGPFVQFRAAVEGNGTMESEDAIATVQIVKDDVVDATLTSIPKTVWAYTQDTLIITSDYTPSAVGNYQVSMTVSMKADDENIEDNGWSYDFAVTDGTRYSRVRHGMEDDYTNAGPRDWAVGGEDGDVCAQLFNFPESTENVKLKGISVYIDDYDYNADDEIAAIKAGEFSMIARVYKNDSDGNRVDAQIASQLYTLAIEDTATWLTLDFVDEGNLVLPAGYYWAGIEIYTGNIDYRFQIGDDVRGPKQPNDGGSVFLTSNGAWAGTGDNYAIDLNMDFQAIYDLTLNVDMSTLASFDAATDDVYAKGAFGDSVMMTSANDVNYTVTVGLTAGSYTYSYFTSADVVSNDYTVDIVDADVVTDDVFTPLGVEENTLELVSLYPNPFNGTLTVENLGNASQIRVSNVLGQTVMTVSVTENRMDISTDNLEKGIYLVTIVDNNNNSRTERVVKK